MQFKGYYINLGNCIERNNKMKQQLLELGIAEQYQRFEAISGQGRPEHAQTKLTPGHLGCWLSHQKLWAEAEKTNSNLHIMEDDAIIGNLLPTTLKSIELEDASWDLLFTDVYFHPSPSPEQFERLRRLKQDFYNNRKITLVDLKNLSFTGTSSYLVNHRSARKLIDLIDGKWNSNLTIDVYLQKLVAQGKIRAYVTIPFLSTIGPENIVTTTGSQGPALLALNAFRESWYYNSVPQDIYARIKPCKCDTRTEPMLGIYLELLRNVLGTITNDINSENS